MVPERFVCRGHILQLPTEELFALAQSSLQAQLEQREDESFAALAERLDEAVVEEWDLQPLFERAGRLDPLVAQYLVRVARTVAAEDVVPAGRTTYRLILTGMGVLLPAGLSPLSRAWRDAAPGLESGLAALWAEDVYTVTVMRQPVSLERAYSLSPTRTRSALLQGFAQRYADEFLIPENESLGHKDLTAYVLPIVIAARPERAKAFMTTHLAPGPISAQFSALKHRYESSFEQVVQETGPGAETPGVFPPLSWTNVFPVTRAFHMRKSVHQTLKAAAGRHGWSLSFRSPRLALHDPAGSKVRDFYFPEETDFDMQRIVAPLVKQLGICFGGALH